MGLNSEEMPLKLQRFAWLGLYLLTACAGGSSKRADAGPFDDEDASAGSQQLWEGFQHFPELGFACTAAWAEQPTKHYGTLALIPCSSGAEDCEQVVWESELVQDYDDFTAGDPQIFAQLAVDAAGKASKLLLAQRRKRLSESFAPSAGVEAVVYDLSNGKPTFVLRSRGSAIIVYHDSDGNVERVEDEEHCLTDVAVASEGVWVVSSAVGGSDMFAGYVPYGQSPTLRPIEASSDVLKARMIASDEMLGLQEPDGKLARVGVDATRDLSLHGPGLRVWLESAQGSDLLAYNDKGDSPRYFLLNKAGEFEEMETRGTLAHVDGDQAIWLKRTTSSIEVLRTEGPTDEGTLIANLEVPKSVFRPTLRGASVVNGVLSVVTAVYDGVMGSLVNLETGQVAERRLEEFTRYVGHDGHYIYVVQNGIDLSQPGLHNAQLKRYKMR